MYQGFVRIYSSVEFLNAPAVVLSIFISTVSCLCPNASSILTMHIAILVLRTNVPASASAADDTTYLSRTHYI